MDLLTKIAGTRRRFLQGASVMLGGMSAKPLGFGLQQMLVTGQEQPASLARSNTARVSVYQDKAIFDHLGVLPAYEPPTDPGAANRHYVRSVDETTFYSRHWFV